MFLGWFCGGAGHVPINKLIEIHAVDNRDGSGTDLSRGCS